MSIYLLNCFITTILGLLMQHKGYRRNDKNMNLMFLFFILLIFWSIISAYRGINVGSDTNGYIYFYNQLGKSNITLLEYLNSEGEILFNLVEYVCCRISGGNWVFFSFIISIITYIPFLYVVKKEKHIAIVLLLYIFSMSYYFGFNAMRQAVAVSICFFAYKIFFQKKFYIRYFVFILIAFGFHSTAIYVIPFHIISNLSIKSKLLWFILVLLLISSLFFNSVWNIIMSLFSFFGNDSLAARYINSTDSGSGYIRILTVVMPVFLGVWKYDILKKCDDMIDNYLILLMLSGIFMVFSINNWLFARLFSYFTPFLALYISRLIYIFKIESRITAILIICTFYFAYMVVLLLHGESGLYPYNFI